MIKVDLQKEMDDYVYSKMIQSMMFYQNVEAVLESPVWAKDVLSIDFLKALRDIVKTNEKYQFIEPEMKKNLYKIVNYIRFTKDYQTSYIKKNYHHFYNEIIRTLNTSGDRYYYIYYIQELNKRYDLIGYQEKIFTKYTPIAMVDLYKEMIYASIANDFGVLVNQSEMISDELFYDEIIPMYVVNNNYIDSINAITKEFPLILYDDTFTERTKEILTKNKTLIKKTEDNYNDFGYYRDLSRRNNKVLKKINKQIK
ncbi:MAG: hypothetical protein PHO63_03205 [Bacilli bacterium]|nr:hypothetical protein [Bacilli bacterium]MDD4808595.1 hypothetical protein [Bacilli bacterium]